MQLAPLPLRISAAIFLSAAGIPVAHAQSLSASDTAAIDALAQGALEKVRTGQSLAGVQGFFGSDSLATSKAAELQLLAGQVDSTIGIYGPMGACEMVEQDSRGSLVVNRLYLCSHAKYVVRWTMMFAKTTKGWSGANMMFDDKIGSHLRD